MRRRWVVLAWCAIACAGCGAPSTQGQAANALHTFVVATHPHGVPYDEAKLLTQQPGAEAALTSMLNDQSLMSHRDAISVLLGILATPAAAQKVVAVIQSGAGPLRAPDVIARMDAVTALGYAAFENADPAPLNFLIDGLRPTGWPTKIIWRLPEGGAPAQRLRSRCISALGLSGRPQAQAELLALQTQLFGPAVGPPATSEQALVLEALKAYDFIASHPPNGLSRYYATYLRNQ